jgi:PadR family transcriptional regulator PadR
MALGTDFLGDFEQLVLMAVLRLGDDAYAVTVREEIESRTGRSVSRGAIYITLDRLEKKGYLESRLADPTPERGGRSKRYHKVNAAGAAALKRSRSALEKMWQGLEPIVKKI